ncbi:hypothetical protein [Dictyobacter arantiisoli]|uniref:Uncharacterized protein n=1 Tax=Dictyobacter arantiisoli TaxID=2014874 RepID=A0A5A5THH5_9CHLR|nr:hypothetical protein [Dictyobacter arantiisoli]GCF10513.1 hypothetical protein KDI_40770 [Dictyobacter arantiisoli]
MNTPSILLTTQGTQRAEDIRQECEQLHIAQNFIQPTLGRRIVHQLGHALVVVGSHLERREEPKTTPYQLTGNRTGQLHA